MLFDCFRIQELWCILGCILIQLPKKLINLTVIATASRPETVEWVNVWGWVLGLAGMSIVSVPCITKHTYTP
jgi:hypothetical protein